MVNTSYTLSQPHHHHHHHHHDHRHRHHRHHNIPPSNMFLSRMLMCGMMNSSDCSRAKVSCRQVSRAYTPKEMLGSSPVSRLILSTAYNMASKRCIPFCSFRPPHTIPSLPWMGGVGWIKSYLRSLRNSLVISKISAYYFSHI